ncbi:MAG: hypothetical protein ACOY0T_16305 [Myxococcota bacterium]
MKIYLAAMPLCVLALACGSKQEGSNGGTGGTTVVGFGGASSIAGNSGNASSGGANTQGSGGGVSLGTSGTTGVSVEDLESRACAGTKIEPESLPAVLQIVLDNSLSMNTMTNATNGQSKWVVTRAALQETIDNLPKNVAVGLLYYPNRDTQAGTSPRDVSACVNVGAAVPIATLGERNSAERQTLRDSLERTSPAGATPTHDAYTYGLNQSLLQTTLPGARYMVLITDGGPTLRLQCLGEGTLQNPQPTQPIIDSIRAAYVDHQVKTFLVGVPGTEDIGNATHDDGRPWMSRAAVMGASAFAGCNVFGPEWCHIDLTQAADFSAALRKGLGYISRQIVSCSYEVPEKSDTGEIVNPNLINVIYTPSGGAPTLVEQNANADCRQGWQLAGGNVVLCPDTCEQIQADAGSKFELLFGCDPIQAPIK